MTKIVKIGAGGDEIEWQDAVKKIQRDDVLLLEPGFYEWPQGLHVADFTIKGSGASPEDTVIYSHFTLDQDCRFFTLENLCLMTKTAHNALYVDELADTYLTLRNVTVRGGQDDTAAIAVNGKCTIELYSCKILGASVSMFSHADFRLVVTDSLIDYPCPDYSAIGVQGHGTMVISSSTIKGSITTYQDADCELDLDDAEVSCLLIHGQTWANLLNSEIVEDHDAALYGSGESWLNIVNCLVDGGVCLDQKAHALVQNTEIDRLIACDQVQLTLNNSTVNSHADFQNTAYCDAMRVTFSGSQEFEYFLALADQACLVGQDLVLNPNQAVLAVKDGAKIKLNVIANNDERLKVEYAKKPNVNILGMRWNSQKPR